MAMTVKKNDNEVRIQWRVADIKIPNNEIKNVTQDQDIHAVPEAVSYTHLTLPTIYSV